MTDPQDIVVYRLQVGCAGTSLLLYSDNKRRFQAFANEVTSPVDPQYVMVRGWCDGPDRREVELTVETSKVNWIQIDRYS